MRHLFTVFFKAEVEGKRFLSSTVVFAKSKTEAARIVMNEYSYARGVTSVMMGR